MQPQWWVKGSSDVRQVLQCLEQAAPHVDVQTCIHVPEVEATILPICIMRDDKQCMHYAGPTVRRAQATGSVISHLALSTERIPDDQIVDDHWLTGTSALSVRAGVHGMPYDSEYRHGYHNYECSLR